jgi:IS30 family transposase
MRSRKHLTISDRRVIKFFLNSGLKQCEIAKNIGVAPSTLSYELKMNRGSDGNYDPDYAQKKYSQRRIRSRKRSKFEKNSELLDFTIKGLQKYWSPEQIVGKLKMKYKDDRTMLISTEGIYLNIYNGTVLGRSFIDYLRQNRPKRQKRKLNNKKRVIIKDKKNIKSRPEAANNKSRIGHWEGDTVVGKNNQGYIATFVDGKTSYLASAKMPNKKAVSLNKAASEAFGDIENKYIKTITVDNGTEFAEFKNLEKLFKTKIYFADPYCSWQRGLNENTNGLLRQFFPKKTNLNEVSEEKLEKAIYLLNHRPRKKLGYLTPYEVFIEKKKIRVET